MNTTDTDADWPMTSDNNKDSSDSKYEAMAAASEQRKPLEKSNVPATRSPMYYQSAPEDEQAQVPAPTQSIPDTPKAARTKEKVPNQIPVETQKPEFDRRHNNMIIDGEIPIRHVKNKRVADTEPVQNEETQPKDAFEKHIIIPRQSEVSANTRPMNILNQVLNTRIDLAFGEVLGMSKELSGLMCDKIKLKSIKAPPQANIAASFQTKS
ncbi:hypothetical protein FIBSPDRAFT_900332 [Athelia psychrophila]|uniref:Uncharacterized protein n=1 Tax=Athelia psychrophila TaxID=1759441 RepID=A0A165YKH6_9AGAM|nr:hypothetical protein FIBSPDRAFT_900332 [Fibularhizoctonia sp. CBS 109695]